MATKEKSTKLIDFLTSQISKSKDQKEIDAVGKACKEAGKRFQREIDDADTALDAAQEAYTAICENVHSTGANIMSAERAVTIAESNLSTLKAIQAARF